MDVVQQFIEKHNTVTLATNGENGPCAAAVFYALNKNKNALLFISKPKSEHIKNIISNNKCAATIQEDGLNWELIKGVQLKGEIRLAKEEYWAYYFERYPFINNNENLKHHLKKVDLYTFDIKWARIIDNSEGLGNNSEFKY